MKKSTLFSISLAATISAYTSNFQFTSELNIKETMERRNNGKKIGDDDDDGERWKETMGKTKLWKLEIICI
ncbi:hypothetical protein CXB51_016734 [Gossypium anomalum]|uniref:Uncharacterized protein n=1 Tax=Gossypium anomalum TaxID=47600 RepID=A0A8J6CXY3_9ROSI|nr:hypothetical protein CXB51_016734 [Gossypium anomalum]